MPVRRGGFPVAVAIWLPPAAAGRARYGDDVTVIYGLGGKGGLAQPGPVWPRYALSCRRRPNVMNPNRARWLLDVPWLHISNATANPILQVMRTQRGLL